MLLSWFRLLPHGCETFYNDIKLNSDPYDSWSSRGIFRFIPNTREVYRLYGRRCSKHMAVHIPRKLFRTIFTPIEFYSRERTREMSRGTSLLQDHIGAPCVHLHPHMPRLPWSHHWRMGTLSWDHRVGPLLMRFPRPRIFSVTLHASHPTPSG